VLFALGLVSALLVFAATAVSAWSFVLAYAPRP
jgi:hypothetical protein